MNIRELTRDECFDELREMKSRIEKAGRKPTNSERESAIQRIDRIDYIECWAIANEGSQPTRPALGTTPDFEYNQSHWRKVMAMATIVSILTSFERLLVSLM